MRRRNPPTSPGTTRNMGNLESIGRACFQRMNAIRRLTGFSPQYFADYSAGRVTSKDVFEGPMLTPQERWFGREVAGKILAKEKVAEFLRDWAYCEMYHALWLVAAQKEIERDDAEAEVLQQWEGAIESGDRERAAQIWAAWKEQFYPNL